MGDLVNGIECKNKNNKKKKNGLEILLIGRVAEALQKYVVSVSIYIYIRLYLSISYLNKLKAFFAANRQMFFIYGALYASPTEPILSVLFSSFKTVYLSGSFFILWEEIPIITRHCFLYKLNCAKWFKKKNFCENRLFQQVVQGTISNWNILFKLKCKIFFTGILC